MLESCEGFVLGKSFHQAAHAYFYYVVNGSGYRMRCIALFSGRGWKLQSCDSETEGLFVCPLRAKATRQTSLQECVCLCVRICHLSIMLFEAAGRS